MNPWLRSLETGSLWVLFVLAVGAAFMLSSLIESMSRTSQAGLDRLVQKYPRATKRLQKWMPRWENLRTALLLWFTATELMAALFLVEAASRTGKVMPGLGLLMTAIVVPLAALFLHALPKAIARSYADRIAVSALPLSVIIGTPLYPAAVPVTAILHFLQATLMKGSDEDDRPTSEDEIRSLVSRAADSALEADEKQIIQSVFDFGDTITREIMTPRVDLESFEDTEPVGEIVNRIKGSAHSRFPVYHHSMDDARGVVHVKDLLTLLSEDRREEPVNSIIKEVPFVPETMPISDLLQLLRSEQAQLAIVVDEYGGTAGVVTMEDIMEKLVGDIQDEYDREGTGFQKLSDGSHIIEAKLPVDQVNKALGINVPESEDYDSVGGYVFHELGRIPRPGEHITGPDFHITVQTANARQIQTIRIAKKQA